MHLKMSSGKCRPFCFGPNVLIPSLAGSSFVRHGKMPDVILIQVLGLYSLSGWTSYRKISWILEAVRFGFKFPQSLWNLTGTSAALPRCLSNFKGDTIIISSNLAASRRNLVARRLFRKLLACFFFLIMLSICLYFWHPTLSLKNIACLLACLFMLL